MTPLLSEGATAAIVLTGIILTCILLGVLIWKGWKNNIEEIETTQHIISDGDLLKLFQQQPDGYLDADRIAALTGLTKKQAKFRLTFLAHKKVLRGKYTKSMMKMFYALAQPIQERELPKMSNEPFLTTDDLINLFKSHNYRLTLQDICLATGLPISIIDKEMNYFAKEKIVQVLFGMNSEGMTNSSEWVLQEPYRSNPKKCLELEDLINPELEKIYAEEHKQYV